ncbi:MAG: carbamoyltransferase HypF [Candidatus Abyssobacteria bacterium SURF_5]|uniref:Carbamoyltransferase n=1 Tax=Abyssobacteria bacterium (strain SURF_5) TaxID=2093360 RepID=A0A3A4NUS2_ABYX5|nr:MAG: carbamoyltransferase HypF [Candidatus Abyssubacteria bacterium SURF_5]
MRTVSKTDAVVRKKILVTGVVQGVGFRPFVFRKAREHRVGGFVTNTRTGVLIEAEGGERDVRAFVSDVTTRPPLHASIVSASVIDTEPRHAESFQILRSEDCGAPDLSIAPDSAVCADCVNEVFDPADRRYRYPFNGCIHCGPRYSLAESAPFDREATSMRVFKMCGACRNEYKDTESRRFHSQINSCPSCGPHIRMVDISGRVLDSADVIAEAIMFLKEGRIVAVKGLGGFHLAANAQDEEAVKRLRLRKQRPRKPFALMSAVTEDVLSYAEVSDAEKAALSSPASPIVLLRRKPVGVIADGVAPGLDSLGVMLAYTPLHHLLLRDAFPALVMTSANRLGEPLIYRNEEALSELAGIADLVLLHDRDIVRRCDDSIVRFAGSLPILLRRSRGFVPRPIMLESSTATVSAYGAHKKNTVCVTRGNAAHVSRYIGDLDYCETRNSSTEMLEGMQHELGIETSAAACDLHAELGSSQLALERARGRLHRVQHHHAHAVSSIAENHLLGTEVLAVVFDGAGLGEDGSIWGSEFLAVRASNYRRLGHMKYILMPGGEAAVREPYRMAFSYLHEIFKENAVETATKLFPQVGRDKISFLLSIINNKEYAASTCGMGRLFDAVGALLRLCTVSTYEGEGPTYLEAIAAKGVTDSYAFQIHCCRPILVDPAPVIAAIVSDIFEGRPKEIISACFHNAVCEMTADVCGQIREETHLNAVVLTGGVFQNGYVLEHVVKRLGSAGFSVYFHRYLPPNDECISLGQAIVANERGRDVPCSSGARNRG